MPKKIHDKLVTEAKKKGLSQEEMDKYVFGTLAKIERKKRK